MEVRVVGRSSSVVGLVAWDQTERAGLGQWPTTNDKRPANSFILTNVRERRELPNTSAAAEKRRRNMNSKLVRLVILNLSGVVLLGTLVLAQAKLPATCSNTTLH